MHVHAFNLGPSVDLTNPCVPLLPGATPAERRAHTDAVLEQQGKLSAILRRHMLRREKSHVTALPPKERLILSVPMAALQRRCGCHYTVPLTLERDEMCLS